MANCASVATRSGHERRANLHFELVAAAECERNLNGRAGQAASRLPAPVRARGYTRGRTCSASTAASRSLEVCSARAASSQVRALGAPTSWKGGRSSATPRSQGSAAAAGTVSGDRAPSRPATARQDDEARRPLSGGLASKTRRLRAPLFARTSQGRLSVMLGDETTSYWEFSRSVPL